MNKNNPKNFLKNFFRKFIRSSTSDDSEFIDEGKAKLKAMQEEIVWLEAEEDDDYYEFTEEEKAELRASDEKIARLEAEIAGVDAGNEEIMLEIEAQMQINRILKRMLVLMEATETVPDKVLLADYPAAKDYKLLKEEDDYPYEVHQKVVIRAIRQLEKDLSSFTFDLVECTYKEYTLWRKDQNLPNTKENRDLYINLKENGLEYKKREST